ncbi:MAG TPA: gamma-glutamyltransferase family protein [Candidatus Dormibacteraeota bacterium]|nr:gamma-glutamyltransferase family protein [Candidatus Dormibacteraeota bacterium]
MVSSTHWLASQSGMAVLERGGNAFDAAVAAGFVLQVVEPHMNGLGGDLPIILWDARKRSVEVICGQGPAPNAATIAEIHKLGLDAIPGAGLLAACVPGAFGAWLKLLADHGSMRLRDVLQYAMDYAGAGYPLVPAIAETIAQVEPLFRREWSESARIYLSGGMPKPNSLFRNPDLAGTLERILKEAEAAGPDRDSQIDAARKAFYEGFVAEAIDAHCRKPAMDGSGRRHAGLLTADDLSRWNARVEPPTQFAYGAATVHKTGPWGQGPVFLQQLALLRGVDLKRIALIGADYIHLVTECAKLAFADRETWYGDPDFADVPLPALLDESYTAERRGLIRARASLELRPGTINGRQPSPPWTRGSLPLVGRAREAVRNATFQSNPLGDTCHVDVVDRFGNMVAATPSGGWLQSSPVIPGLGFCLGSRAQMFNLHDGHPNALAGGKRPRTTLSPTLVTRDGEPWLAFGTPGGDQQDQWSFNFFLAHVNYGFNLQEAIDTPMFHTAHFPSSFYPHEAHPGRLLIEDRIAPAVATELRKRGHHVERAGAWALGRLCVAGRDPQTGELLAAANPRGMQGYAVGR